MAEIEKNKTCSGTGYQAVSVAVPISVVPFAKTGTTVTKCCGTPNIKKGTDIGVGAKNGKCDFIISQKIIVEIPVSFGADAVVGDTFVTDLKASSEEILCEDLLD
jgi:hypothetical protein